MLSFDEDEVSPSINSKFVSRYLIRPQFSIPEGPNTGSAIPSASRLTQNIMHYHYACDLKLVLLATTVLF